MTSQRWTPHVIATAVIEQAGRYLLVEEHTRDGVRLNLPGGHLERGESPQQAVVREALEETAHPFMPTHLVGLYLSHRLGATPQQDTAYLRLAFAGEAGPAWPGRALDTGILRTLWFTPTELRQAQDRLRTPAVLQCVEDHAAGRRFPLDLVHVDASALALMSPASNIARVA